MPVDPSIILGVRPPQLDNLVDQQAKAQQVQQMGYQNMIQQRAMSDDQATRSAYQAAMTMGPDGNPTLDRQKFTNTLTSQNPMLGYKATQDLTVQDAAQAKAKLEIAKNQHEQAANLLSSIPRGPGVDPAVQQAAYEKATQAAIDAGFPGAQNAPKQYPGDSFIQNALAQTLDAKDQLTYQQKAQENQLKHEENSIKRDQLHSDKVDKYTKDMKNDLDADKGRAGNFGIISAKVEQAQRLQTLIHAFQSGNDLPKAQMEELALGLSNMLAPGGGGSRDQVKALVPSSALGDTNAMVSYIANQPRGAGQGGFVDQIAHTIDREAATANDQLNEIRAKRVGAHGTLRQMAPDAFNRQLRSYGMDPANIDANGNYKVPAAPAADGSGQVPILKTHEIEWAK